MADPYTLIPQLAAQYGQQAGQDSFYSTLGQMGQGLGTALTQIGAQEGSSPWLGLAGSLGGGLVQGYAQGGVQQAQQQATNDAYTDMLNAVTASSKGLPSNSLSKYGQLAAPLVTAAASQRMAEERDLAKRESAFKDQMFQTIYPKMIEQQQAAKIASAKTGIPVGESPFAKPLSIFDQRGILGAEPPNINKQVNNIEAPPANEVIDSLKRAEQQGEIDVPEVDRTRQNIALEQAGGDPIVAEALLDEQKEQEKRQYDMSQDAFARANTLRDDFKSHEEVETMPQSESMMKLAVKAARQDNPQGDYALASSIAKLYDPKSINRPSEIEGIFRSQAIPDWVAGEFRSNVLNGSTFTPRARRELLRIAKNLYQDRLGQYNKKFDEYSTIAERTEVDPFIVVGGKKETIFAEKEKDKKEKTTPQNTFTAPDGKTYYFTN